jgi:hypothetical protein
VSLAQLCHRAHYGNRECANSLVFNYNDLRIEKWNVVSGRPVDISDFADYAGCVADRHFAGW